MEIFLEVLLLVAMVAVGASGLYVAATFNTRRNQYTTPLIDNAVENISTKIGTADEELRRQLQEIGGGLQEDRRQTELYRSETQARLDLSDSLLSSITSHLLAELEDVKHLGGQINALREQFDRELLQLNHQVSQLNQSLAQQSSQVAEIDTQIRNQGASTTTSIAKIKESLHGIGERQSKANGELATIIRNLDRQMHMISWKEDYDRWAAEQMPSTIKQIEAILRSQSHIQSYLHARLDYEAMKTISNDKFRIITATLQLSGPGANLVWPLLSAFSETLMLNTLLADSPPNADLRSYLFWTVSDGQQLEEILNTKLAACLDNSASRTPDLEALRTLALALHGVGPGIMQLGPMIIIRTPRALLGCVMTAAEAQQVGNTRTLMSPDACEASLLELPPSRVIDLTSWADSFVL